MPFLAIKAGFKNNIVKQCEAQSSTCQGKERQFKSDRPRHFSFLPDYKIPQ